MKKYFQKGFKNSYNFYKQKNEISNDIKILEFDTKNDKNLLLILITKS